MLVDIPTQQQLIVANMSTVDAAQVSKFDEGVEYTYWDAGDGQRMCQPSAISGKLSPLFAWLQFSTSRGTVVVLGQSTTLWQLTTADFTVSAYVLDSSGLPLRLVSEVQHEQATFIVDFYSFVGSRPDPAVFDVPQYCPAPPVRSASASASGKPGVPLETLLRLPPLPTDLLLTPMGWFPRACIHAAPGGSHVHNFEGRIEFHTTDDPLGADNTLLHAVRRCPFGRQVQRALLRDSDNESDDEGDGWQQYAHQKAGPTVDVLLGSWNVPPNPEEQAQTFFTFTGLQNVDWVPPNPDPSGPFDIIQPVLQFGYSAAGGGGWWTIASWYVTLGSDVAYSPLVNVTAGDAIFGNMTRLENSGSWFINTLDTTSGRNSTLSIHRSLLAEQPWIYGAVLEVYYVDDCEQYPAKGSKLSFHDIKLVVNGTQATPNWSVGTQGQRPPVCKTRISIEGPSDIEILF